MDFHLERQLRLKATDEIEHKNLYQAAVIELDDHGVQVGRDMIPWGWTTFFTATELSVSDSIRFESKDLRGQEKSALEISRRHLIQVKLRPGDPRRPDDDEPTYRMFGTDRTISDITLDILPATSPEDEGCTAWGSVSYSAETDFRTDTTPDVLHFYLQVSQAVYERYLWNIGQGLANEVVLAVGFVDGFYSEWSPSISTREIKVLAGSEHVVQGSESVELPRLGKIGKLEFFMNARGTLKIAAANEVEPELVQPRGLRWPGRRQ